MGRIVITLIFLLTGFFSFGQNEAESIFIKATEQLLTTNLKMSMNQKTTDKKGRVKEKSFDLYLASFEGDEKMKMLMTGPERAKGVTIIISTKEGEDGIIEVYTPANGKTRKMVANDRNMATVGSNFSFSAYNSSNWKDLNIQLLAPTELNEKPCFTLHVSSKENSEGGKAQLYIDQANYEILQILTFDATGLQQSLSVLSEYQGINGLAGKIQPRFIQTQNLKNGENSELRIVSIEALQTPSKDDFVIVKTEVSAQ